MFLELRDLIFTERFSQNANLGRRSDGEIENNQAKGRTYVRSERGLLRSSL